MRHLPTARLSSALDEKAIDGGGVASVVAGVGNDVWLVASVVASVVACVVANVVACVVASVVASVVGSVVTRVVVCVVASVVASVVARVGNDLHTFDEMNPEEPSNMLLLLAFD